MPQHSHEKATVFVVDDDQAMRNSLKWLIESVGVLVESFASADDFLANFESGRPGCVVLDVRMPGMSGLELQEHLVSQNIRLPVVIITGHGDVPMAVRAMKAGAVDFIEKPFNDEVLLDAIRRAIAFEERQRSEQSEHHDRDQKPPPAPEHEGQQGLGKQLGVRECDDRPVGGAD